MGMDSCHVALVSLLLRESAFAEFKCERPTSLGMNVDSLAKILKMCSPNDSLKVRLRGAWLGAGRPAPGEVQLGERGQRLHAVLPGAQDRRGSDALRVPRRGVGL